MKTRVALIFTLTFATSLVRLDTFSLPAALGQIAPTNESTQSLSSPPSPAIPLAAKSMDDLTEEQRRWIEGRITSLIEQLGDDSYAVRQRAAIELQRIGMLAFEQLRTAMLLPDPQVSSTAHSLLQKIHQDWSWDSDPLDIREVLDGYGRASLVDRGSRIDRLAKMGGESALAALCRICRYETYDSLSRHAAIQVLKTTMSSESPEETQASLTIIRQVLGSSHRVSSEWLQKFSLWLESKQFDITWWRKTVAAERQLLLERQSSVAREDVLELNKWLCSRLVEMQKTTEALEEADSLLEFIPPNTADLLEMCHWAMTAKLPVWIESLNARYPVHFSTYTKLGYALAESWEARGDLRQAEELAEKVFRRGREEPQVLPSQLAERQDVARMLRQRSKPAWALREFKAAWETADPLNRPSLPIFFEYSSLLEDEERFADAADVWKGLADRLENEPLYRDQINFTYPEFFDDVNPADALLGNYYYLRGLGAKQAQKMDEAMNWLQKSTTIYSANSESWIELYRLTTDEEGRKRIRKEAAQFGDQLRERARLTESNLLEGAADRFATHRSTLARALNELAWLLANTDDDLDEALECAKRACELVRKNPSYLDTLARVHFQRGDVAEAIRLQEQVVALEPYRKKMVRVLNRYRQKGMELKKEKSQS